MLEKPTYKELQKRIQELEQAEFNYKINEKTLQASLDKYRAVVDFIPSLVCSFLPGGEISFINKAYCDYFGKTADELVGSNFLSLIPEADHKTVMNNISALTVGSPTQSHEHMVFAPNKAIRWQRWTNRAIFDDQGKVVGYYSIGEDITERKRAEDALKVSEERFRRIFEDIILGIFQFTSDGRIIQVNPAFSKMFGYASPEHLLEAIGDSASQLYTNPGDQKKLIRQILDGEAPLTVEVNFCRRDGSNFVGNFHGWKVIDTSLDTLYMEGFIEDITERKLAENSLQESHKRLQILSARLLSAQESERRRISLEIHDDMGQDLALLKMHLITIVSRLWKDQQKHKDDINRMLVVIDRIIEKARNLSRDLNPAIIEDLKLSGALSWLINEIEKHVTIRISLDVVPVDHLFSIENQIVIYRIIQEALKNIVKHAKASTAAVTIKKHTNCVLLLIEDDGRGFDVSTVWNKHVPDRGLGLAAMDERGRMLSGTLDIQSTPGHGTCVSLRIPIRREKGDE